MADEIYVDCLPDGTMKVSTNIVGSGCLKATATLEAALGVVLSKEKTVAYHQKGEVRGKITGHRTA